MRRRGFSLAELLFTLALAALIVGLALLNARSPRSGAEAQGLANVVADELRLARQTAMSRHIPVAVGLPTQNGSLPCSQSFYVLSGEDKPRLTRVVNLAGDYPGAIVAHALWGLDTSQLKDPSLTNTCTAPPTVASSSEDFALSTWLQGTAYANTQDVLLLFTPSGSVQSNGAVLFDGEYHLMVSEGAEFTGGSPANPGSLTYVSPARVSHAFTITLSPTGQVSVVPGLKASMPAALDVPGGIPVDNAAPAVVMPLGSNTSPKIEQVVLYPTPPDGLPPNTDVMVQEGQHATMRVEASDADGDELYCEWQGSASQGRFASATQDRMQWDPRIRRWVSTWEWYPSDNLNPDDIAALTCRVYDRSDQTSGAVASLTRKVVIGRAGRIMFHLWPPWSSEQWDCELASVNLDGSGQRYLTEDETDQMYPAFSPDGSRVVFSGFDETSGSYEMFLMNYDGSGIQQITSTPNFDECGPFEWSPDGTRIALQGTDANWDMKLVSICPDGTSRVTLGDTDWVGYYEETNLTWAPDSGSVVYTDAKGDLRWSQVSAAGAKGKLVRDDSDPDTLLISPHWSPALGPGGAQLAFVESYWGWANKDWEEIALVTVDPSNGNVAPGSYRALFSPRRSKTTEYQPVFDPSGQFVSFETDTADYSSWEIFVARTDGSGLTDVSQKKNSYCQNATWTRNGKLIYMREDVGAGWSANLFLGDPAGGAPVQLTDLTSDNNDSAWPGITRQPASFR